MNSTAQTENERRLTNLIRFGIIAEVNHAKALVRVESGGIKTDWLPWLEQRTGKTRTWNPPTVGEQCLVLAIGGEFTTATVLTGLFTANAPSQSPDEWLIAFPDNAEMKYNHASGHFSLKNCKTAEVQASGSVKVDCPSSTFTGNVEIQGTLTVGQAVNAKSTITASGGISSTGGDVKAGAISLKSHKHTEQGDGKDTSAAKA